MKPRRSTRTKHDLICRISIMRDKNGMSSKDAVASVQGYRRKSCAELEDLLMAEYEKGKE